MSWLDVTQYESPNHSGRHRYDNDHHHHHHDPTEGDEFHQPRWRFGGYDDTHAAHNLQAVSYII